MTEHVQKILYDVLKTSVGVFAVSQLDLASKIPNSDRNLVIRHATNGLIYFLVSDGVDYASGRPSKLLSGSIKHVVDDTVFFGGLSLGTELTGVDAKVADLVGATIASDRKLVNTLVDGVIVSTGRIVGDYIDATPEIPHFLKSARHVTNLIDGTAYTM